jgi:hypothetical protein
VRLIQTGRPHDIPESPVHCGSAGSKCRHELQGPKHHEDQAGKDVEPSTSSQGREFLERSRQEPNAYTGQLGRNTECCQPKLLGSGRRSHLV